MKKIIIFLLILLPFISSAQSLKDSGYEAKAIHAISLMLPPSDTLPHKLGLAIKNGKFFYGNGTFWQQAGSSNTFTQALADARYSNLSHTHNFTSILSKPTNLAGYGITDAYPLTGNPSNFLTSIGVISFSSLSAKPTSLTGYGITDAYPLSGNPSGFLTSIPAQSFASLTGKPTTLAGYGITDGGGSGAVGTVTVLSATNKTGQTWNISNPTTTPNFDLTLTSAAVGLSNVDNTSDVNKPISTLTATALNGKALTSHSHAFNSLTSIPSTLSGYGITDAFNGAYSSLTGVPLSFTPTVHNHLSSDITNLSSYTGFDIRYYTEGEINVLLSTKSNSSHTHAYSSLTSIPSTFTPSAHNHLTSEITNLSSYVGFDARYSLLGHSHTTSSISDIASYTGFDTRYFTETETNTLLNGKSDLTHNHTFSSLTFKPTTIDGYGIIDAFTESLADIKYSQLGHKHPFSDLTSTPTTYAGYGLPEPNIKSSYPGYGIKVDSTTIPGRYIFAVDTSNAIFKVLKGINGLKITRNSDTVYIGLDTIKTTLWDGAVQQSRFTPGTLIDGSTITWDITVTGKVNGSITLTGTGRILAITNPIAGEVYILKVTQDGTGSRTITTYPGTVKWVGGVAPTLTTTAGKTDILSFYYDGTNFFGNYTLNY